MFKKNTSKKTVKLDIGMPAPDFVLKESGGKEIRLSDFRGKNVLIAFFPLAWTPI
jgi:peroxiredoxin